ncbi:MFS transporter [Spirillospora sp. NPDC029432]|uniref:MFS transporter n=1 Tax=Spirillospora sp. NPDC029432 TaxID=3154599 RepID=UPI0034558661
MTLTTPPPDREAPPVASVTAVVGLLVLFEIVSGILQAGIAPILPSIGELHGVSDSALTWVVSVQLLAAAVCVPAFGRLGDLYGHRRMLRVALISVAIGSVLVAVAPSFPVLLLGRFLQGPLAALLPLEIALVRDRLPVEQARKAIARLVGALTLGGLLGTIGLGMAEKAFGDVRGALWLAAALAVICVPVSFVAVPESLRRAAGRADWPGICTLSLSMLALMAGVSTAGSKGWLSASALVPILLGAALLALWVRIELRTREPLVDLRAMAGRNVAPFYGASFVFGVLYFGSQSPNSTFLAAKPEEAGYGFGLSAVSIAMVMLPALVLSVAGSVCTPYTARLLGYRGALMASFGMVALATFAFALFHDQLWQMAVLTSLLGLGMGTALGAMPTVIVEATDPSRTGIATALYNNVKTLGGALAGGVFGTVLTAFTAPGAKESGEGGYVTIWVTCGICALLAVAAALLAQRQETTTPVPQNA